MVHHLVQWTELTIGLLSLLAVLFTLNKSRRLRAWILTQRPACDTMDVSIVTRVIRAKGGMLAVVLIGVSLQILIWREDAPECVSCHWRFYLADAMVTLMNVGVAITALGGRKR